MLSGPGMNIRICGECVTFAKQLLLDKRSDEPPGECSFCGRTQAQTMKLVFGPGVNMCSECITFASQRLDGGSSARTKTRSSVWRRALARVRFPILGGRVRRATAARV